MEWTPNFVGLESQKSNNNSVGVKNCEQEEPRAELVLH